MLTKRDLQHFLNVIVRTTFKYQAGDPDTPKNIEIDCPESSVKLQFTKAHGILRGYKGYLPGIGQIQVLEQNPQKIASWCGYLVKRYGLKLAWLWKDGNYHRCLVDMGGENVLWFDATGGADKTKDEVKAHPQIKAFIEAKEEELQPSYPGWV